MAFVPVTVDDVLERFPKFEDTDELVIAAVLEEAAALVDDSWIEADRKPATLYLVAHLLTQETGQQVDRPGTIVSESFGPMSVSYGQQGGGTTTNYAATEYGRRFQEFQRRNFPGVLVV